MRFNILGPFEVLDRDRPLHLGSPKQRAVLAMLVVEVNRVVSVDRLVDQLWGEDPPRRAVGSLHAYVSNLRRILEQDRAPRAAARTLVSRDPGYCLAVDANDVDAVQFEALAGAAGRELDEGRPAQALELFDRALSLWRGPVLADFTYETFAAAPAQRLEELRRGAAERRAGALLLLGQHDAAVAELEELVQADPLREGTWAQLMVALYRASRQADALRAFQRARTVLGEELGIDPGPALQELERAVLAQDPRLHGPPPVAPPPAPSAHADPAPPDPAPDDREPGGALIGRHDELESIDAALEALRAGRGGVVLVTGDPGVGKTALLTELARRGASLEFGIGFAQSTEDATVAPLWPWREILRQLDGAAGAGHAIDEPLGEAGAPPDPSALGSLLDGMLQRLRVHAHRRPVVVVLDDAQWSDELTHRFLQLALTATVHERVLFGLGVRDPVEHPTQDLLSTRAAVARHPCAIRLPLVGLDRVDVAELAARMAGEAPSPSIVDAVYDRTSGNPFFVSELVRLLRTEHALHDTTRMSAAGVPHGARDVIRRRLASLPEQAGVLLSVAAVLGRRFDASVLRVITGVDVDDLLDLLDLASVSGLLIEEPDDPGTYRFTHDLVREALYCSLSGLRRAHLHAQAVAALLAVHGDVPAIWHELARHAVAAAPETGPDQALRWLSQSARLAQRQLAVDLAERQLRTGLALIAGALPLAPPAAAPDLRRAAVDFESRQAQIQFHQRGRPAEAAAALQRARAQCDADDVVSLVAVASAQAVLPVLWGDLTTSASAAAETVELARQQGDAQLESDAEYCAAFQVWTGTVEESLAAIGRAVALAEAVESTGAPPAGPHVQLAPKHGLRAVILALAGDVTEARAARRAALALGRRDGAWALGWGGALAAFSAVIAGDADDVGSIGDEVETAAAGLPYTAALVAACRAWAGLDATVSAGAAKDPPRSALDAARAALAAAGDGLFQVPFAAFGESGRALADVRADAERAGFDLWLPEIDRRLAAMYAGVGEHDVALALLEAAAEAAAAMGAGLFASRALADLAALEQRPSGVLTDGA